MSREIRKITCIACPNGCQLEVDEEDGRVIKVTGNKCEKGDAYARQEVENPMRIISSTVLAKGLNLKMVPVRTNKPIPKARIFEAMAEIRKIRLDKPVKAGNIVVKNFLGLDVDLTAARPAA
jgi:CxxC motif-containing protein